MAGAWYGGGEPADIRRTSDDGVGAVDDGRGVVLLEACLLGLVVGARVLDLVRGRGRARVES